LHTIKIITTTPNTRKALSRYDKRTVVSTAEVWQEYGEVRSSTVKKVRRKYTKSTEKVWYYTKEKKSGYFMSPDHAKDACKT